MSSVGREGWRVAVALFVLAVVLFIRTTRGLDLTDEMQYYGQLKGLADTGRLFSNDLFIQQCVYILLYPGLRLYHWLFGLNGIIVFCRVMMAVLTTIVFAHTYKQCLKFRCSAFVASLAALSVTFAIPYHGIFAPSYNTISQVIWIVFLVRFFEWRLRATFPFAALVILMFFAHPTSAAIILLIVSTRLLIERQFEFLGWFGAWLLGGGALALLILACFGTPAEYLSSIAFSSGYGVGEFFFSTNMQPVLLACICALFGFFSILGKRFPHWNWDFFMASCMAVGIILMSFGMFPGGYGLPLVCVLAFLSAGAYGRSLSGIAAESRADIRRLDWLAGALLAYSATLGVTSGNGIGQATGAFMAGLPLLVAFAAPAKSANGNLQPSYGSAGICAFLVAVLFLVHWTRYPYREVSWWRSDTLIADVSAFRLVSTSPERASFLHTMTKVLKPVTEGRRTLIISEIPGLYFALGSKEETCMLYMHSLRSKRSEAELAGCLAKRKPEIIIDIYARNDIATWGSRVKMVMRDYYGQLEFVCEDRVIGDGSAQSDRTDHFLPVLIRICKRQGL